MATIHVTDRDGNAHEIDAPEGEPLMEALRDQPDEYVEGICGGECACGTCHVYVAPEWLEKLSGQGEDEQMMLEAIGELIEVKDNSRLSCQIKVDESLDGMTVEVAPEF